MCSFIVSLFMMPEENLVCFVLCISHYEFISSSWWFDAHRMKIFFVIGLQRRLLHAITASVTQIKIQVRFIVYISKGFFDWSTTFLHWKCKKILSSFIQTWFEQFGFSCGIWELEVMKETLTHSMGIKGCSTSCLFSGLKGFCHGSPLHFV